MKKFTFSHNLYFPTQKHKHIDTNTYIHKICNSAFLGHRGGWGHSGASHGGSEECLAGSTTNDKPARDLTRAKGASTVVSES